jgi:mono/diheme cytochrome c family protein
MTARSRVALWASIGIGIVLVAAGAVVRAERARCAEPRQPPRYPAVADVIDRHCGACHDARRKDDPAAQRVFESSRYPFATERPATLLADLEHMIERRGGLSDEERCRVLGWLRAGGLDADGRRPPYQKRE